MHPEPVPDRLKVVPLHGRDGLLERLRAGPVRPAFCPIADLRQGLAAGYEVTLRIDDEPPASPRGWADAVHPLNAFETEKLLVTKAREARARVGDDRFLAVGISASAILDGLLEGDSDLEGLMLLLSDDTEGSRDADLARALTVLRDAGARLALDDTGSSYTSLRQITRLEPDFVRIGGDFVRDLDRDHAKAAVVETLVAMTARIDAAIIAGDVPGLQELDALRSLGVPFAQGPLFGQARDEIVELPESAVAAIRDAEPTAPHQDTVAGLVEAAPALPWGAPLDEIADAFLEDARFEVLVLVDERSRPLALAERSALLRGEPYERPITRVAPSSPLKAVARRAVARPSIERFHPLVACDRRGVYLGIVRVEQLLEALAAE
jgi:EAL domain-containing protein (putative c-di-GMP-specific phosphodiesterase class I)